MGRFISKYLLVIFFFLTLVILKHNTVFAGYTITQEFTNGTPVDGQPSSATEYIKELVGPDNLVNLITENTKTVWIHFDNLADKEYKICLKSNPAVCVLEDKFEKKTASGGRLDLALCPAGKDTLKLDEDQPDGHCSDDDYFWGQHTYTISIHDPDHVEDVLQSASLYAAHYYPFVVVGGGNLKIGDGIRVTITGLRRPEDNSRRNNYVVELARQNDPGDLIQPQQCTDSIMAGGDYVDFLNLDEGDYLIKINEQVDEKGIKFWDGCQAGFTYYHIKFTIRRNGGKIEPFQPDPAGRDIAGVTKVIPVPPPPCAEKIEHGEDGCSKVQTAVGPIETKPEAFVKSVFGLVLGLSGGIALLLIIYGGYQLMASRGKPEATEAARDQITAAIIGLLFIIFALVLLQVIGYDILKIPAFK